jgi:hypothetical protein
MAHDDAMLIPMHPAMKIRTNKITRTRGRGLGHGDMLKEIAISAPKL